MTDNEPFTIEEGEVIVLNVPSRFEIVMKKIKPVHVVAAVTALAGAASFVYLSNKIENPEMMDSTAEAQPIAEGKI